MSGSDFALWEDEDKRWMAGLAFMDKPSVKNSPALSGDELVDSLGRKLPATDLHRLELPI